MPLRIKKTWKVEGMTCPHCEERVKSALQAVAGVQEATADFRAGTVRLVCDSESVTEAQLAEALEAEGYSLKAPLAESRRRGWSPVGTAGLLAALAGAWLLIQQTVGFNFIPEIRPEMGYGLLFVIGLITSLHCIAMCGGINLSQCIVKGESGVSADWRPSLYYNGGRVISYTVIGGLVGALGAVLNLTPQMKGAVGIVAGVFMILMGIGLSGFLPEINRILPMMPAGLRNRFAGKGRGPLYVGLLNGLMPCGPLQAMQLYALGTGNFIEGAASMLFFSLGTVPLMFGLGALSTVMSRRATRTLLRVGAVLVILLGVVMLQRGLSLNGFDTTALGLPSETAEAEPAGVAVLKDGVQTVTVEVQGNAYGPITVQKGVPVKLNFHAAPGTLNGCNEAVVMPAFGIEKPLVEGDNFVEFVPAETGTFGYSCWMGMIRSSVTVVDTLESPAPTGSQIPTDGAVIPTC